MSHILRSLERKSGMVVNGAFGFTGRPGRVNEHERIHALHRLRRNTIGAGTMPDCFIPIHNPISMETRVQTTDSEDTFDAVCRRCGLAGMFDHRHLLSAAVEGVSA